MTITLNKFKNFIKLENKNYFPIEIADLGVCGYIKFENEEEKNLFYKILNSCGNVTDVTSLPELMINLLLDGVDDTIEILKTIHKICMEKTVPEGIVEKDNNFFDIYICSKKFKTKKQAKYCYNLINLTVADIEHFLD
jgi:hypothetical protein